MDSNSASLLSRFTALKNKYIGLETWISVGGWSFTDPGPTQEAFSTMTSNAANRQQFINGLLKFMNQYGFDGGHLPMSCLLFHSLLQAWTSTGNIRKQKIVVVNQPIPRTT